MFNFQPLDIESPIQNLPKDILIFCFSYISDFRTLFQSLPLVCKYWNQLFFSNISVFVEKSLSKEMKNFFQYLENKDFDPLFTLIFSNSHSGGYFYWDLAKQLPKGELNYLATYILMQESPLSYSMVWEKTCLSLGEETIVKIIVTNNTSEAQSVFTGLIGKGCTEPELHNFTDGRNLYLMHQDAPQFSDLYRHRKMQFGSKVVIRYRFEGCYSAYTPGCDLIDHNSSISYNLKVRFHELQSPRNGIECALEIEGYWALFVPREGKFQFYAASSGLYVTPPVCIQLKGSQKSPSFNENEKIEFEK